MLYGFDGFRHVNFVGNVQGQVVLTLIMVQRHWRLKAAEEVVTLLTSHYVGFTVCWGWLGMLGQLEQEVTTWNLIILGIELYFADLLDVLISPSFPIALLLSWSLILRLWVHDALRVDFALSEVHFVLLYHKLLLVNLSTLPFLSSTQL